MESVVLVLIHQTAPPPTPTTHTHTNTSSQMFKHKDGPTDININTRGMACSNLDNKSSISSILAWYSLHITYSPMFENDLYNHIMEDGRDKK